MHICKDLILPRHLRGRSEARTLRTMDRDLNNFQVLGHGNLDHAKEYNNCIAPHLFDIEVSHVRTTTSLTPKKFTMLSQACLPGLHITLGVFFRLFTLMEDECHKLDIEMAVLTTEQPGDRQAYIDHSSIVRKERTLLDEKSSVEGEVTWLSQTITLLSLTSNNPSTDPQIALVSNILTRKKERIDEIVSHIKIMM